MGIEMSFRIIFLGTEQLSPKDYARFIEKHKLSKEYLLQSSSFLTGMRETMNRIKASNQYLNYTERYRKMIKQKKLEKEDLPIMMIINAVRQYTRHIVDLRPPHRDIYCPLILFPFFLNPATSDF